MNSRLHQVGDVQICLIDTRTLQQWWKLLQNSRDSHASIAILRYVSFAVLRWHFHSNQSWTSGFCLILAHVTRDTKRFGWIIDCDDASIVSVLHDSYNNKSNMSFNFNYAFLRYLFTDRFALQILQIQILFDLTVECVHVDQHDDSIVFLLHIPEGLGGCAHDYEKKKTSKKIKTTKSRQLQLAKFNTPELIPVTSKILTDSCLSSASVSTLFIFTKSVYFSLQKNFRVFWIKLERAKSKSTLNHTRQSSA